MHAVTAPVACCMSQPMPVTSRRAPGTGDLNSRRGMVAEFIDKPANIKLIKASVPLSEMFQYVSTLRGMTKGRAQYTMQLQKYDVVPNHIQESIVAGHAKANA